MLYGTIARGVSDPSEPIYENFRRMHDAAEHWGEGRSLDLFAPSSTGEGRARLLSGGFRARPGARQRSPRALRPARAIAKLAMPHTRRRRD